MVKCFVEFCKSGYTSCKDKVSMFKAPSDEDYFNNWKRTIPKRNLEFNKNSHICSKHFKADEIVWFWTSGEGASQIKIRLKKPKLLKGAIPSVFPSCPVSNISKIVKKRKSHTRKKISLDIPTKVSFVKMCKIDPDITLIEPKLEYVTTEETFSAWDAFSMDILPDSSWAVFMFNEMKVIAQIELSCHLQPKSIIVKEIRVLKNSNCVRFLVMGNEFGTGQTIFSLDELKTCISHFHAVNICRGVQILKLSSIKIGLINQLNRWQSTECTQLIETPSKKMCSNCFCPKEELLPKL